MVAGEFAVLVPGHELVVMAVDRYVHALIEDSAENKLNLKNLQLCINWSFSNDEVTINSLDKRVDFIQQALEVTLRYLREQGVSLEPFTLTIESELDDSSGRKYGLGSSAAVVTAGVKAIIHRFLPDVEEKDRLIFRLAAIAHTVVQGKGSGADVAASTFEGVLRYRSFQAEWLLAQYEQTKRITNLIELEWIHMVLEPLYLPPDLHLCIGWTGNPASTTNLVEKVLQFKEIDPLRFSTFLENSQEALELILRGCRDGDASSVLKGIQWSRKGLATLGEAAHIGIETPLLKKLSDLAGQAGGVGKLSGAGGGDCGIAFMPSVQAATKLKKEWVVHGITPLELNISIK